MNSKPKSLVGENPEVIAGFLLPFFRALDDANVLWAVKHGWEGLPNYARHDVDMAVNAKDVRRVGRIIERIARETGWKLYGHFRFSNLDSYWICLPGASYSFFQIDLFRDTTLRGVRFFPHERTRAVLSKRWRNDVGIWCLPVGHAGADVLMKELVANGKLEGVLRHEQVQDAVKNDMATFRHYLNDAIKDERIVEKVQDICQRGSWDDLKPLAQEVRKGVLKFEWSNLPGMIRYAYDYFKLRFRPFLRLFVAFVGPDGCGKTTIVNGLCEEFDHRPFVGCMRIHSNFGNAVRLRDIKKRLLGLVGKKVEFAPDPEPGTRGMGMKDPLPAWRSMAYVLYYGCTLALGRITLWKWRTFSGMIVADRYYYDYYYMRGHMKSPKWFKDLIGLIVPKPDIVFYLDRPAKGIFAQKPELEIEEIERQQDAIKELLRGKQNARFIDASNGIDATIRAVNDCVRKWITNQSPSI